MIRISKGILRNYIGTIALQAKDQFDLYFSNMLPYLYKIVMSSTSIIQKK